MWQTRYALAVPINLGLGFDFRPCSEGDFLTGRPYSRQKNPDHETQTRELQKASEDNWGYMCLISIYEPVR